MAMREREEFVTFVTFAQRPLPPTRARNTLEIVCTRWLIDFLLADELYLVSFRDLG